MRHALFLPCALFLLMPRHAAMLLLRHDATLRVYMMLPRHATRATLAFDAARLHAIDAALTIVNSQ